MVTLKNIAHRVGVSVNTVTKALNGKPRVSEQLRKEIIETARSMGYSPNRSAKALSRKEIKIGVIYPKNPAEYYSYIQNGLTNGINELVDYKISGVFMPVSDIESGDEMREALMKMSDKNINGLILSPGVNYHQYYDAIKSIANVGIPIVCLTIDIEKEDRIGCVGLNGKVAGQMAAQLIQMCADISRPCAVLACSKEILSQKQCIEGFVSAAETRGIDILGIYETQDEKQIAYLLVKKLLNKFPNLGSIYVCSYNSVAVCNMLEEKGMNNEIFVVGQDIYKELAEKIHNGSLNATLFQNPYMQARSAVVMMYEYLAENKLPKGDVLITPTVVIESNLNSFMHDY